MNRAVFLDRDGVINKEMPDFVKNWEEFQFLPNTFKALNLLSDTDYKIIIITNQSGIAISKYTKETLKGIHKKMLKEFSKHKIKIDSIKYCPHRDDDNCKCRKPKPGMILSAAEELDINLNNSWLVGDKTVDIKAAENAGVGKTILVKTGYGGSDAKFEVKPDFVAEDVLEAVNIILNH